MNMKKIIGSVILIIAIVFLVLNYKSTPTDVGQATVSPQVQTVNLSQNTFKNFEMTYTGYGPAGKFHEGKFDEIKIEGGTLTFNMNSMNVGIDKLETHLCSDDFFSCEQFPEAKFVLKDISEVAPGQAQIVGDLTVKGDTKEIAFRATKTDLNYKGEFLLDTTSFSFKYVGVDKDVLIKFNFSLN